MIKIFYPKSAELKDASITKILKGSWVHIENPSEQEIGQLAVDLKLDTDMLLDGIDQNETPRIEKYDGNTYLYVRYCLPESEKLTTSPMLIVMTSDYLVTVCYKPFTHFDTVQKKDIQTSKRSQLLMEILSEINEGYKRRINSVSKRIWQIRSGLDKAHINNKDFITFIDIEEDLSDFLMALEPMNTALNNLMAGKYFRIDEDDRDSIEDFELSTEELIGLAQSRLRTIQNIREAYSTMTANNLNKVFKLMTSITILMSVFTIITGIYSMNVPLPLYHNPSVFWVILGVSISVISVLAILFRRKKWL